MKRKSSAEPEKLTIEQRNARLREWIVEHDMLNLATLCRRIPYDRGAFAHFKEANQDLGQEPLAKAEKLLSEYGYDATSY